MVNFLLFTENPQLKYEKYFEVMRNFRKGGLNPQNYDEFIQTVKQLPPITNRTPCHYDAFSKFNLNNISKDDLSIIQREVIRRGIEECKICWHPEAGNSTCNIDNKGKIIISAAHSIQNNGVLSRIVEKGHVMSYTFDKSEFDGIQIGHNFASIFWGFCNNHDRIFSPIEINPYEGTEEQHFLFAYRGFVVSSHKKREVSTWIAFGEQSDNDIIANKAIFDEAILSKNYSIIHTEVFELPAFYPIAVSSSFYLDYDFEGNAISHSEERIEDIFITLLPTENKTYFLLSYFTEDSSLYGNLASQLRVRNNLKSDITMLIAGHTENIYFNPIYYTTFIEQYEEYLKTLLLQTQFDYASINVNDQISDLQSFTPSDYLNNTYSINFFGY